MIDPHADLAEELLNHIPPGRADHLVYFNPGDIEFPVGLNLLANVAPDDDCVGMPSRERFETEESFLATLFHELVHSTGHEKRLKRTTLAEHNGFGSDPYYKEELIAEMGAAFLCGHAEIIERTIDSSAAYIHGWLERIRKDNTLIVQAAAQAQKAADFILGRTPRAAIIAAAGAVLLMHNHPSGEPTPSEADIKVTRDLIRAGQILKIDVLDHVIVGNPNHCSLKTLGYFYS